VKGRAQLPGAEGSETDEAIDYPIDGVLDLHQFRPADAKQVVGDYLDACRERGIMEVRIIHGKGTGTLREIVHSVLRNRPDVMSYKLASDGSGWGATLVTLVVPA
jgi:DNA-nicking Smr family endonuclease